VPLRRHNHQKEKKRQIRLQTKENDNLHSSQKVTKNF